MTDHQKEILKRIPKDVPTLGAEIGVWRGETSFELLSKRPLLHLFLIDPWMAGEPGTDWYESGSTMPSRPQADYDYAYKRAMNRLAYFEVDNRFLVKREPSLEAVKSMADGCFDFIFLDGDHSYETVKKEIQVYLPKVKAGGWIGGHDYGNRCGQVKEAVDEAFTDGKLQIGSGHTWFYKVNK